MCVYLYDLRAAQSNVERDDNSAVHYVLDLSEPSSMLVSSLTHANTNIKVVVRTYSLGSN